ncbi:unnamed protein product [Schistocephalus solidus]|uniref:BLOC-1-related complex subunit 7 n=1 Tax=Schistocephalus solidus TaxID=70667 RepID=A0A183TAT2_SCHSO|nr:unnamed protein product [Schistocephalus solidus]
MDAQGAFSAILAVESSAKQLASRVSCLLDSLKLNLTTLMYSTMAQCEELTKAMSEVPKLMDDLYPFFQWARVKETLQQIENFLLP